MKIKPAPSMLSLALTASLLGTAAWSTASHACSPESYIGSICTVAFNYCPQDTMLADGRLLPISQYQALFSLIGAKFGGDGSVSFALPDLRGRSVVGVGQGGGLHPVNWGQQRGTETTTLNIANLPPHNHTASFNPAGGDPMNVNIPVSSNTAGNKQTPDSDFSYMAGTPGGLGMAQMWSNTMTAEPVPVQGVIVSGTGSVSVSTTGSGQAFNNLPPQLGLMQCIVVNGIYPMRPD